MYLAEKKAVMVSMTADALKESLDAPSAALPACAILFFMDENYFTEGHRQIKRTNRYLWYLKRMQQKIWQLIWQIWHIEGTLKND